MARLRKIVDSMRVEGASAGHWFCSIDVQDVRRGRDAPKGPKHISPEHRPGIRLTHMLMTDLSDGEIVLGKLAAWLVPVL